MKDRFILDSSVWVELHRKNARVIEKVAPLIEENMICLVDVIETELLRGAKTSHDYKVLKLAFANFQKLRTDWDRVSRLAFTVARKGFHPPLIDLYISQCALDHRKVLVTQDRHFAQITRVVEFQCIFL